MSETQGKKEVTEAVVIAALVCLVQGLLNWGLDRAKAHADAKRKPPEPGS